MVVPTSKVKVNNSDLPTLIGSNIVVRSNLDHSQRRGVIGFYDSVKNFVRVDFGNSSFWTSAVNDANQYIFIQ